MKFRFLALLALVLGLASCQKDPYGLEVDSKGEAAVTLNVALPDDATRAAGTDSAMGGVKNVDMSKYDIRYILEVYDEDGRLAKDRMVETTDETSATFSFRLVPGRAYNFVVWADFVLNGTEADLHYNTNADNKGLRKVKVIEDQWDVIDESRDAYTDVITVHNFSSAADIPTITLTRPFAKLRVVTNDIKEMISVRPAEVKVEYISTKFYDTFDAFKEEASGEYTGHILTATLLDSQKNPVDVYSGGLDAQDGVQTLFADYFFGAEDDRVMFTMKVTDNGGVVLPKVTFNTNIPVKRNNLTTVYGPVLTDSNNITVTINDAFENDTEWNPGDDKYDVELISGTKTETVVLKAGKYVFDDVTIKVADGNAIEVEGDVVIDVMGVMTLDSKGGIVVKNGSLVINGVVETRGAERAGILKVETEEGSAIGGSNITIQNLAGLTAKANGKHAFGIGAEDATVVIKNTKIDYVAGGHVQATLADDDTWGKKAPEGGAAIGGANVTIENSEIVKAEGGSKAAAIGNKYWAATNIVIKNSTLGDIFGGNASAAIGGSRYNKENKQSINIAIEGSTIANAVGGTYGAGIGSGYDTYCATNDSNAVNKIEISTSTITAKGGKYAAGIGTGHHAAALTGSIDAASEINATSGDESYCDESGYGRLNTVAQGIGYGSVDANCEFKGAVVTFTVAGVVIPTPVTYNNIVTVTTIEELQAALDAAKSGDNLIHIAANIEGDITVTQKDGVHITIDGKENKYNGTITVNGQSSTVNDKSLTIKNVKFETEESNLAFIASTTDAVRYARNITIEDCTFKGSGDTSDVVALNLRQAYDIEVNNCKATDLHSFGQITSSENMSFTKLIVTSGRGLNFQTAAHGTVVFNECNITATKYDGYGIRVARYAGNSLTVNNSTISAFEPVVLRGTATPFTLNLNKSTLTATGNGAENIVFTEPADIFIDGEEVVMINTAEKLTEAINNAKAGDTITIDGDITLTENVTIPAGVTFNGNGKQINGTLIAGGDIAFAGHTKVTAFSAGFSGYEISIGEGACLEITGDGRSTMGYNNTFNITGTITDAKSADKANIQPSLIIPAGISITGGNGLELNIKDAYVQIASSTSKNSAANGTFTINIENSIAEFTNQLTFSEPTSGMNPTFNLNVKNSVLTTATKLILAAPNCNMVVDNSTIDVKTNFRNSGKVELKNGSVLTGNTIQFGENGGHDGTTTVDASKFTIKASSTGHAYDGRGTGSITLKNGAEVSVDYYKALTINCDGSSTFTGTEVL